MFVYFSISFSDCSTSIVIYIFTLRNGTQNAASLPSGTRAGGRRGRARWPGDRDSDEIRGETAGGLERDLGSGEGRPRASIVVNTTSLKSFTFSIDGY